MYEIEFVEIRYNRNSRVYYGIFNVCIDHKWVKCYISASGIGNISFTDLTYEFLTVDKKPFPVKYEANLFNELENEAWDNMAGVIENHISGSQAQ